MKKFFIVPLTIFALISVLFSHSANASGESLTSDPMPGKGYLGIEAIPSFENAFSGSALIGKVAEVGYGFVKEVYSCKSFEDEKCKDVNYWNSYAMFPMCENDAQNDCIEVVSATKEDGTKLEVIVGEKFPGVRSQDYVGNESKKLPPGGQSSLLRIPGAPHAGGDTYLPIVNPWSELNLLPKSTNKEYFSGQFQAALFAVTVKKGQFDDWRSKYATDARSYSDVMAYAGGGSDRENGCIMNDATICAVPMEMPMNIIFGMKIRTSAHLKSWFSARLNNPSINISVDSKNRQILNVSAKPVAVPAVSKWMKKTDLSFKLSRFYDELRKPLGGTGDHGTIQNGPPETWSLMRNITEYNESFFEEFLLWLPSLGDKATSTPTVWSFRTIRKESADTKCIGNGQDVRGFVSTNATMYVDSPPTFDSYDQSLKYKVAATHYDEKGNEFLGSYDLALRSDVARCLYGFTAAPISATIEVVSQFGEKQIAVTTVNERNGWLYLAAKGFTFSAPTVSVKLTQEAQAPTALKKTSITCVKGKTTKKVTAINPKCPTGYKKK
jgi:hypothetical protein